jgi:hypothetical protein
MILPLHIPDKGNYACLCIPRRQVAGKKLQILINPQNVMISKPSSLYRAMLEWPGVL